MRFEAHIASASQGKGAAKSDQEQKPTEKSLKGRGWQNIGGKTRQQPVKRSEQQKKNQETTANSGKSDKKCFKCGDIAHGVFQCPNISGPAEAKELYEKCTGKRVMKPVLAAIPTDQAATTASRAIPCVVMSTVETSITPDSAAEVSVVTTKLLKQLSARGAWIAQLALTGTAGVTGIGDKPVPVKSKVKLDLRFSTPGGPLILQNVICWVTDQPLPPGVEDLLLSRWIMIRLGYSSDKLLAAAQQVQSVWDMCDVNEETTSGMASVLAYSGQMTHIEPAGEELDLQEDEDQSCFPTFTDDAETERKLIRSILLEKVEEARRLGATPRFVAELRVILMELINVFRLVIGRDKTVDIPPMEVTLKPGAVPSPKIFSGAPNPRSRWCSPPHVINKPEAGVHRMTVDVRGPNECVEQIVWPMPVLEVVFDRLRGSSRYFSLDFFKGFWQFAMAVWCQEIYSILTEEGVITPTRVLMGGTNSVAYVQSTVQEMFSEVFDKGLLIWIDDLLGYEKSDEGLLILLKKVLTICAEKGLKLNPKKCSFYLREALWCGRIVSGEGVRHDPARLTALTSLPLPSTGQDLQQFICAMDWMRTAIPAFNKLVAPLSKLMEKVYQQAGGRKKNQVRKILRGDAGWGDAEGECLEQCKEALKNALQLAHPTPGKGLSVYTDASDAHWGAAITQISPGTASRPLSEQDHEPLLMLSGTFSGSAKRLTIVEKEAPQKPAVHIRPT
ncbi:hypothetical protein PI124_g23616 [Phytophthora idaei]|nr:hypothetical protein PI124_g23616 [Phytophthora idaei]